MAATNYSVGTATLHIIPDFTGIQRASARQAGKVADDLKRTVKKGVGDGVKEGLGGGKAAAEAEGASLGDTLAASIKRKVESAVRKLPQPELDVDLTPAEKKLNSLRRQMQKLTQQIGVEMDSNEAVIEIKRIEDQLRRLAAQATDVDLDIRANADGARRTLALVRKEVEQVQRADATVQIYTNAGDFSNKLQAAVRQASRTLPAIPVEVDGTAANRSMQSIRKGLEKLAGKTIGVDITAEKAYAQLLNFQERLDKLTKGGRIDLNVDAATASATLGAVKKQVEAVTKEKHAIKVEVNPEIGAFATQVRESIKRAQEAIPEIEIDANSTPAEIVLSRIRAELIALGEKKIGVDIDADAAFARIRDLERRLLPLTGANNDVDVDINASAAREALGKVNRPETKTAKVKVEPEIGEFAAQVRDAVKKAQAAIPKITIDANSTAAEVEITEIRRELAELGEKEIGVDIDADVAFARIRELERRLKALTGASNTVDMDVNASAALSALNRVKRPEIKVKVEPLTGEFARKIATALKTAQEAIPKITIDGNSTPAQIAIARIRGDIEALSNKRIGIDVDAATAFAQVKELNKRLTRLSAQTTEIDIDVDAAAAAAALQAVENTAKRLDGREIDLKFDYISVSTFTGRIAILLALIGSLLPALVPIGGIALTSIGSIGAAATAVIPALTALVLGFNGIGEAIKKMAQVERESAQTARQNAEAAANAARQRQAAARQMASAEASLANAQANAASQRLAAERRVAEAIDARSDAEKEAARVAQDSARDVAQAQERLVDARRAAAKASLDAAKRVAEAQQDIIDTERQAADAAEAAARRVADAQQRVEDARESAVRSAEDAARRIADADQNLTDALAEQADAAQDNADRVADARRDAARATEDAADRIEAALRNEENAERSLARAQRDVMDIQRELTNARREAEESLQDLELQVAAAALRQKQAVLDLVEAEEDLRAIQMDPTATRMEEAQATLRVQAAEQALKEIGIRNERLAREQAEAAAKGIEGSDQMVQARQREQDAIDALKDAERGSADASKEVTRARVEGAQATTDAQRRIEEAEEQAAESAEANARRVADARRAVVDAAEAQRRGVADADRAMADAQRALDEATREQARGQEEATRRIAEAYAKADEARQEQISGTVKSARDIADAERGIADAIDQQTRAREGAAERVAQAQQGITDAVAASAEQQRQSAYSIAEAERGIQAARDASAAAAVDTTDKITAAMRDLDATMARLSPTGREFALFLYSLRPELDRLRAASQEGLLPGVTAGLQALVPMVPTFEGLLKTLGAAMGDLFKRAGEAMAGPTWAAFYEFLATEGPGIISSFGSLFGSVMNFFIGLGQAFGSISTMVLDYLTRVTQGMADFFMGAQGSTAFQNFMAYTRENTPAVQEMLRALGDTFVHIIQSMAPFGPVVLSVVTAIANFIASVPPGVLSAIAVGFISVVGALALFGPAINFVLKILGGLQVGMTIFQAVVAALGGPITAIVIGLALLSAAFLALYHHSEGFRNFLAAIKDGFFALIAAMGPAVTFLGDLFRKLYAEFIEPAMDRIKQAFVDLGPSLQELVAVLGPALKNLLPFLGAVLALIAGLAVGIVSGLVAGLSTLVEAIAVVLAGVVQVITGVVKIVAGIIAGDWTAIWEGAKDVFEGLWKVIDGIIGGVAMTIINTVKGLVTGIYDFFVWLYDEMVGHSIVPDLVRDVLKWFTTLDDKAIKIIKDMVNAVVQWFVDLWKEAKAKFEFGIKVTVLLWEAFWNHLKKFASDLWDGIGRLIEGAWTGVKDRFNTGIQIVTLVWEAYWNYLKRFAGEVWDGIGKLIEGAWGGVKDRFNTGIKIVKDLWDAFWNDGIRGFASKAFDLLGQAVVHAMEGLRDRFQWGVDWIKGKWETLKDALKGPIKFMIETVINKGVVDSFNWIANKVGVPKDKQLTHMALPEGLRKGGILPGRSSWRDGDDQLVPMRRGEGVAISEAMEVPELRQELLKWNQIGLTQGRGGLRKYARGEGYARGGIVDLGRWFAGKGARPGEHPAFGGVQGRHSRTGGHYDGRAIDFNYGPGGENPTEKAFFDQFAKKLRAAGWIVYWRDNDPKGHSDHLHVAAPYQGFTGDFPGDGILADIGEMAQGAFDFLSGLSPIDFLKGKVNELMGGVPGAGAMVDLAKAVPSTLLTAMTPQVASLFSRFFSTSENDAPIGVYSGERGALPPATARAAGKQMLPAGWSWEALDKLWTGESGWRYNADNPTSSAYGIPQALTKLHFKDPAKRQAYMTDAITQIQWGLNYINNTYGTSQNALAKWQSRSPHWYAKGGIVGMGRAVNPGMHAGVYDSGGVINPGYTGVLNLSRKPEALLTNQQWADIREVAVSSTKKSTREVNFNGNLVAMDPNAMADLVIRRMRQQEMLEVTG